MNDNDVIKALECCNMRSNKACSECPYHEHYDKCITKRNEDIVDLINRQKAENEKLKDEKLKHFLAYEKDRKRVKSEAIKEFAEMVYRFFCNRQNWNTFKDQWIENGECYWLKKNLNNLVKEMAGE